MRLRLSRRGAVALAALVVATGLAGVAFFRIGPWLVVSDPLPTQLDVLFTFGGENQRLVYSRELMEKYPDAHWVLSDFHHYYTRILKRTGFSMKRVSIVDSASSTLAEVRALADWIQTSGLRPDTLHRDARAHGASLSIGLVSSPHHMRRIRYMVNDVFEGRDDLVFRYLPVPYERFRWTERDMREWWRNRSLRAFVESEIGKLFVYWVFKEHEGPLPPPPLSQDTIRANAPAFPR